MVRSTSRFTQRIDAVPEIRAADAPVVGVLALQGDVAEHLRVLAQVGAQAATVKRRDELERLDGLVIPGGESTTIGKLAELYGLLEPLRARIAAGLPVLGTCAGAILLARQARHPDGRVSDQPLLATLDAVARRNAFGRQVDSFETAIAVSGLEEPVRAAFIRAPWFEDLGDDVEVLASVETRAGRRAVVVRQDAMLATAFHPEVSGDARLHRLLVQRAQEFRKRRGGG